MENGRHNISFLYKLYGIVDASAADVAALIRIYSRPELLCIEAVFFGKFFFNSTQFN